MKRVLLAVVLVLIIFCGYWFFMKKKPVARQEAKAAPLVSGRHSASFDVGIDSLLNAYFEVKNAFVNADSNAAKAACEKLIPLADSNRLTELKKDEAGIYESASMQMSNVKINAESLVKQTDLTEMRQDFNMIGESIYPLLKAIHYEGKTVYWQNCPMAFGEDKGANWISNTAEILNPYLGNKHPEFKAAMVHCGEIKDSIKAQ